VPQDLLGMIGGCRGLDQSMSGRARTPGGMVLVFAHMRLLLLYFFPVSRDCFFFVAHLCLRLVDASSKTRQRFPTLTKTGCYSVGYGQHGDPHPWVGSHRIRFVVILQWHAGLDPRH